MARIPNALAFAEENLVLLARHQPSGVNLDISFAWLAFESEAFERAGTTTIGSVTTRTAHPEDLVIYKVLAGRPVDVNDAEALLIMHEHVLDLGRIRRIVADVAEIADDAGPSSLLEQLIRRSSRPVTPPMRESLKAPKPRKQQEKKVAKATADEPALKRRRPKA